MNSLDLWNRYQRDLCRAAAIGLTLDISRMSFEPTFRDSMSAPVTAALDAMERLERGARANIDEDRMVGHYWLRKPELAPDETIRRAIESTVADIKRFAESIHDATLTPQRGDAFDVVLVIGIGGSALGPRLISDALGTTDDAMIVRFLDNTDPDGIDRTLAELDDALERTLTLVISKSGGTKETRNAMVEVQHAYRNAGLQFAPHAVAVTCEGSALCEKARSEKWLAVVPIWDWVGGRTSVTSAVGLLPAALQGLDVDALLNGAAACDAVTRGRDIAKNPAALMALMWYYAGEGRGQRHMVVIPYRDRLALLGAYLQQLVMESVGKEKNREGHVVHQGLTVYGNKGSTDQHAYVQQLRDGRNDFFVTFLNVVADRDGPSVQVEEVVTTGDYLHAFWLGTRAALHDNGRESMTLTLNRLDARAMGVLIALFERAVGLYAELIDVNAYNQPGVEAGKKAATAVLQLQRKILAHLGEHPGSSFTVDEIAAAIGETDAVETVHHVLQHLAARHDRPVTAAPDADASRTRYTVE